MRVYIPILGCGRITCSRWLQIKMPASNMHSEKGGERICQ